MYEYLLYIFISNLETRKERFEAFSLDEWKFNQPSCTPLLFVSGDDVQVSRDRGGRPSGHRKRRAKIWNVGAGFPRGNNKLHHERTPGRDYASRGRNVVSDSVQSIGIYRCTGHSNTRDE